MTHETCTQKRASEPTTAETSIRRTVPLLASGTDAATEERWLFERIAALLHPGYRTISDFGGVMAIKIISQHGPSVEFDCGIGYLLGTVHSSKTGEFALRLAGRGNYVLGEAIFFSREEFYG